MTFLFSLLVSFLWLGTLYAESDQYIYRSRVNWVKINPAKPKEVPVGSLLHPQTSISTEQMEAMLLSIQIDKKYFLSKKMKTRDIFSAWEARKYAPYLVEALAKVDPDHVVNFSVVHKRPIFILQKDYLTIADVWITSEGVYFQFSKIFAKLDGDYLASANTDKAIRNAKTMRISLSSGEGQKLSYFSPMEIIMDPNYDFASKVALRLEEQSQEEEELLKGEPKEKEKKEKTSPSVSKSTPPVETTGTTAERLKKLDTLKKQGLITQKEYDALRQKILSEI